MLMPSANHGTLRLPNDDNYDTQNSTLSCKFVCTSAAFYLKRVPAALFSVNLIKFNRALSRI